MDTRKKFQFVKCHALLNFNPKIAQTMYRILRYCKKKQFHRKGMLSKFHFDGGTENFIHKLKIMASKFDSNNDRVKY